MKIYLANSNVCGATYRARQDLYTDIYSVKFSLNETQNSLKVVIIGNSKTSLCRLSNCLVWLIKSLIKRNDCRLGVNRI